MGRLKVPGPPLGIPWVLRFSLDLDLELGPPRMDVGKFKETFVPAKRHRTWLKISFRRLDLHSNSNSK